MNNININNINNIIDHIGLGAEFIANRHYGYVYQERPTTTDRNVTNYTDFIFKILQGFIPPYSLKSSKSGIYSRESCKRQICAFINTKCPDKYFRYPLFKAEPTPQRLFMEYYMKNGDINRTLEEIRIIFADCNPDIYEWALIDSQVFLKTQEAVNNGKSIKLNYKQIDKYNSTPCFMNETSPYKS